MDNVHLTPVQKRIMMAVLSQDGLPVSGLYQLALDLGIDYRWARRCVRRLEDAGLLYVIRPYGREMFITAESRGRCWFSRVWGAPVLAKLQPMTHNSQNGGSMDDPIPSLRDDYSRDDQEYPRPDLTADEEKKYLQVAANLANLQNARQRAAYVAALVYENVRLLKEVNEHRAARGYELLPVYDPVIK